MIIQNLDSLSTNARRKSILDEIPNIFSRLDPENVCQEKSKAIMHSLDKTGDLYVIGFGKASLRMYTGVRKQLGSRIRNGMIVVPDDQELQSEFSELKVLHGTHPLTSQLSQESTENILDSLKSLKKEDTVIVLISGGGSALFESPVQGVTIQEIAKASECLMNADANIYELNTFRKFFSRVKGGKLVSFLKPAKVIALVISDVFGDDLSMISSGPLTPSPRKESDLIHLVSNYAGRCPILNSIKEKADLEPLNENDFDSVTQYIVLRNRDFVDAFSKTFDKWGVEHMNLGSDVNGDVEEVANRILCLLGDARRIKKNGFWFSFGGETTVQVRGKGKGGRNQELSLRILKGMRDQDFLFMSIGTDGIDGMSPAMGGLVDSELRKKISDSEIDEYLKRNDSFTLLNKYSCAIMTGRTGTNVSDIAVGFYDVGKRDDQQ